MQISMIAGMSLPTRVIWNKWKLPWNLPEDLQKFKEITTGHTIIMGRKTYESIWRPLPNRRNIVLSSKEIQWVEVYHDIDDLLEALQEIDDEIFIIWGENIYKQLLDFADKIYLTEIKESYDGDTYFPVFEDKFEEVERESFEKFDFVIYNKKRFIS